MPTEALLLFAALYLSRFDTVVNGELAKFRYNLMVGHADGVPFALVGLIPQIDRAFGHGPTVE